MLSGELADLEAQRKEDDGGKKICTCSGRLSMNARNLFAILQANPKIVVLSSLVFAILCGAGVGIIFYVKRVKEEGIRSQASQLAHDTITSFCTFDSKNAILRLAINLHSSLCLFFLRTRSC